MTVGDAILLKEAEMYNAQAIFTWNKNILLTVQVSRFICPMNTQPSRLPGGQVSNILVPKINCYS